MIQSTLKHIQEQTGMNLDLCEDFPGLQEFKGTKYFNVILSDKTSESKQYSRLKAFADTYGTISIEPNGVRRVAVFIKNLDA